MSICRTSKHILGRSRTSITRQSCLSRSRSLQISVIHNRSEATKAKYGPKIPALRRTADLIAEARLDKRAAHIKEIRETFTPYSEKELQAMSQFYTEAQMEALIAAEKAVSTDDLAEQWGERKDNWKINYLDDLAQVDPFVDFQPKINIGHAPVMRWRGRRDWAPEELEITPEYEEIAELSEHEFEDRFDTEYDIWQADLRYGELNLQEPEQIQKLYENLMTKDFPAMFDERMRIESLPIDQIASSAISEALSKSGSQDLGPKARQLLENYNNDSDSWEPKYALQALSEINAEEEDITQDFRDMGPFSYEEILEMNLWSLDESHFVDHESYPAIVQNIYFDGMSLTQMLYKIEKSGLDEKVKAALRPLYTYKDTHKELYAKRILRPFVTEEELWHSETEGYRTIKELFHIVETLKMNPVKKAELLAYSHWADTPKGDSLRPVLERAIAAHQIDPVASSLKQIELKQRSLLGDFPMEVEGPHKKLYSSPIYQNVNPPIPRIEDPMFRYDAGEDDAASLGMARIARDTGFPLEQLKKFKVKQLLMRRVVNQTRKGKIPSLVALCVAGNEDGLLGIGEGKAFEPEDASLKAKLAALRDLQPIVRYERRTIFGELNAKVGACTVKLMAQGPGYGLRTQALVHEIARHAGIRDLAARVGRSRNKMNTIKATVKALREQQHPEEIAKLRGRKMVDVRKVYYGQSVC